MGAAKNKKISGDVISIKYLEDIGDYHTDKTAEVRVSKQLKSKSS
jgi:hypothetical protein